ncbi:MAG TPA: hypothetical protein VFF67_03700 [Thermoplasmata archaeon]|nr:hypothetical protein [Thermoplasmata archaeon]
MVGWPPLGSGTNVAVLASVAVLMAAIEVYLLTQILPRRGGPPTLTRMILGVTALFGTAAMLLSLVNLLFFPSSYTAVTELLWGLNFMMFVPPGIWFVALIVYQDRRVAAGSWGWPVVVALTVTVSEFLMGLLFSISASGPAIDLVTVGAALTSPWLLWTMAAVMVGLALWVPLERTERWLILSLAGAAGIGPWVAAAPLAGSVAMSGPMALAFVVVFARLSGNSAISAREMRWLVGVMAAFAAMAGAAWLAIEIGGPLGPLVFGGAMSGVMIVEVSVLVRRSLDVPAGPFQSYRGPAAHASPSGL